VLSYLHETPARLISDLNAGKSLAKIARSNGKTVGGLEHAMTATQRAHLDQLVAVRLITRADANKRLARFERTLPKVVTSSHPIVESVHVMRGRVLMGGSER
jgi:hypothetical protein